MVLEYMTNGCMWNMVDAPKISLCNFDVEEDVRKISDKSSSDWGKLYYEILKLLKEKYMFKGGYSPEFKTELHIENKQDLSKIKEIIMVAVNRQRGSEIHFFDSDFPFRICCNDGSIFQESKYFII